MNGPQTIPEVLHLQQATTRTYFKGRMLGRGAFAHCYEFACVDSNHACAVKVLSKKQLVQAHAWQKLQAEINLQATLGHPNVVQLEGHLEDTDNVYLFLELCPHLTLGELLRRRTQLTEVEAQSYCMQLLIGLKYLHQQRIVHRDLKPDNLFLAKGLELKIGDFGLAARLQSQQRKVGVLCGTPNYIAPEMLSGTYSFEGDVWAVGVILYTLLVGTPPFQTSSARETYRKIRANSYSLPQHLSKRARALIQRILVVDRRPSVTEVLEDPFFHPQYKIPTTLPTDFLSFPPPPSFISKLQLIIDDGSSSARTQVDCAGERQAVAEELENCLLSDNQLKDSLNDEITVKKWTEHNSGLGFLLSDGTVGALFLDNSRGCIRGSSIRLSQSTSSCPQVPDLVKFKFLLALQSRFGSKQTTTGDVFVKQWVRSRDGVLFRLSNSTVQMHYRDRSELRLSRLKSQFTYKSPTGESTICTQDSLTTELRSKLAKFKKTLSLLTAS